MTWEDYRNFGYLEVDYRSNGIRVYSDRIYSTFISSPQPIFIVESAMWQGNNIIIRCRDQYDQPRTFIQRNLNEAIPI